MSTELQSANWPHENEIWVNDISGEFVSIDCMGKSLVFFTPAFWKNGQNKKVLDSWMFLAEFDEVL